MFHAGLEGEVLCHLELDTFTYRFSGTPADHKGFQRVIEGTGYKKHSEAKKAWAVTQQERTA